jgi:triacylglycerol esterase/lipase EstA (alpha/beta hydrolase family)/CHAT domain-containing protein
MAAAGFDFRFHGVTGGEYQAPSTRDGSPSLVLPARVLSDAHIEVVGGAAAFELDPALPSRGGDWSGLAGTVEILSRQEREDIELLLVRCGSGYRVIRADSSDDDRLLYRVPVSPGPGPDRGAFGAAARWVIQKVVVPFVGDFVSNVSGRLVTAWEASRRPHSMRYFTPARYRSANAEPVEPDALRPGRVLLLLHGTNAQAHDINGLGGMPQALIEHLNREYDQVIAFDHPTLATSPNENAERLAQWLRAAPTIESVDILCHSRGGLVARSLVEQIDAGVKFGSVVFVATPHRGTELADPEHLGGFVDRMLTLAMAIPDNPVSLAVEGVLTVARELAAGALEGLDGIVCMRPGGKWLTELGSGPPKGVAYRTVVSDFESAPGSGLWHALKDAGVDVVFGGLPNDVVVPTLSALHIGDEPGDGFTDMVVFDELDVISHSRYFGHRLVQPVLEAWLGQSVRPLPNPVSSRRRSSRDVRVLSQLGAEWSFAGKVMDLTCIAPESIQPGLQETLARLGARMWKAVSGRGDGTSRSTVVLLPGLMGSELATGDHQVWLSPWRLAQGGFGSLRLDGDSVGLLQATKMLCFAYRQFLEYFRQRHDVVEFPYDWRMSIDDSAASLLVTLQALVSADDRPDGQRIHIIAHSMGGLVVRRARQLAARGDGPGPFPELDGNIVLLGTPSHGSFAVPLALVGRHSLVSNLARLDVCLNRRQWLDVMWTFPGLIELLPDPLGVGRAGTKNGDLEWLYEIGRWVDGPDPADVRPDPTDIRRRLDGAREFWSDLRADTGEGLHVVLGDGHQTPIGLRPVGADQFEVALGPDGDGTVSIACGKLDQATTYYAHGTRHGDLVRDKKVLAAVGQLLETGGTRLLRTSPQGDQRSATALIASSWLSPEAAELELDGRTASTRGVPTVSIRPPAWTRREVMMAGFDAVSELLPRPTPTDESPDLQIKVVHGSLEGATYPVLVGHATGTPIAGAEARCDELLERHLSELNVLGSYPNTRGSHLYVPATLPEHRLYGCVIVALDSRAPLSTGELSEYISRAVVDYAERRRWERRLQGHDDSTELGLSAVPVGSGPALLLGVERSVDAVVAGVQRANEILASQSRPVIRVLEFVERYTGKVERIMRALQRAQERVNAAPRRQGRIDLGFGRIEQREGALAGVPPPSYEGGRWEVLSVEVEKPSHVNSPIRRLSYRFARDRAAVSERPRQIDRLVVGEMLREAVNRPSRSTALGMVLFEELLPVELKDELGRVDNLVLQVDELTADVPWELLVDRLAGTLPLACRAGLLRQFRTESLRARSGAAVALRALVVGDPPTEHTRLPGARQEAEDIWRLMRSKNVEAQLLAFEDRNVEGLSSAAQIKEAFRTRDHRIIHIAAHGIYRVPGEGDEDQIQGGVAIGKGAFLTAEDFANLRIAPDLVFLNCCHLGRLRPGTEQIDEGLLDPVDQHQAVASIARRLMDIGVKAVVVAGWAVGDQQGLDFATRFYREVLDGQPYGDAVRTARLEVFRPEQSDNTWAAYQCYGDPGFQLATPSTAVSAAKEYPLRAAALRQLEELYVRAGESPDLAASLTTLSELDEEVARRWPGDGELLDRCGELWGDLGKFAEAVERYERAITQGGGAPLQAIEKLVNMSARQAVKLQQEGRPAEEINSYIERATRWAAVVESLGSTSERRSIEASLHKRLVVLHPHEWKEHLTKAIDNYTDAARQAVGERSIDERDLYGFRNAIQLASLCCDEEHDRVADLMTKEWIERWASTITSTTRSGDFWTHVGRADSMLTAALVPANPLPRELCDGSAVDSTSTSSRLFRHINSKARQLSTPGARELRKLLKTDLETIEAEIAAAYKAARPRGRIREWNSVVEHAKLMHDIAQARAHPAEPALASLVERLS